jgi:hypothetical protein
MIGVLSGRKRRTRTMMATVCKRGTIMREWWWPPMTAVAMGGATPKDNETGTLLQLGGDSDGTADFLVGSPPGPLLANIIHRRRDTARKRCCLVAILTMTTMVQMTMGSSEWMYPLWLTNSIMPVLGKQMQWEYIHFNKLRISLGTG